MKQKKAMLIQLAVNEFENLSNTSKLCEFISKNHSLVTAYRAAYFKKLLFHTKTEKDKFIALFIDSINAGGIGRLNDKSESLTKFENKYLLTYKDDKDKLIEDLFGQTYKQLKLKKSGLLILSAYYTGLIDEEILNKNSDKIVLPIDAVILRLLSYIMPKYQKVFTYNSDEIKKQLTNYAKKTFGKNYSDYVKFDDLWLWGHITTQKNKDEPQVNDSQINLDPILRETSQEFKKKGEEFIKIINEVKTEAGKIAKM